jgi:hypothetical protein
MSFGSTQKTNQSSTTTPVEQDAWTGLKDQLIQMSLKNLINPEDMTGYTATGVGNINNAADAATLARNNALASRGLSSSPIAGNADVISENARAGDIATFENTIPLLQRDFGLQDWTKALQLFASRPIGSSSTGTETTKTSQSPWGAILGAIAGGTGSYFGAKR